MLLINRKHFDYKTNILILFSLSFQTKDDNNSKNTTNTYCLEIIQPPDIHKNQVVGNLFYDNLMYVAF